MQEPWNTTISKLADAIFADFVRRLNVLHQPVPQSFLGTMLLENLKFPAHVLKALFLDSLELDHLT